MRNRSWSDVVVALMIALCVAAVAESKGTRSGAAVVASTPVAAPNVAESAQSLADAVLFSKVPLNAANRPDADRGHMLANRSATARAMVNAAEAAGNAARDIEMPFFSFGGDAGAE